MAGENEDVGSTPEDRGDLITDENEKIQQEADAATRLAAEKAENEKVAGKEEPKVVEEDAEAVKAAADKLAADAKEVEDKKPKTPEPRMPLSRHREILNTERARADAAEKRLAEAEAAGSKSQMSDDIAKDEAKIDELEVKYEKQLADGDIKDATATRKELRLLERSVNERTTQARIQAATFEATESVRFDAAVERLENEYPQIQPGNEKFDVAKVKEVLELQAGFVAMKYTPTAALQKAVGYVLGATTARQVAATDVEEQPGAAKGEEGKTAAEVAALRKEAAVKKAAEVAGKQPPSLAKAGLNSDEAGGGIAEAKSVMKMKYEDFAKLGDEELSRMRGDAV